MINEIKTKTRALVNVRLHIMSRPELIYIFDLIVNQMEIIKNRIQTNRNTSKLIIEFHKAMTH